MAFSLLHLLLIMTTTTTINAATPRMGVTINHHPILMSSETIAAAIHHCKITSARLIDQSLTLIRAFSYSPVSLLCTLPNSLIPSLSSNRSSAASYLYSHVIPFYPRINQ